MMTERLTRELGVEGARLTLDGEPFPWQGISFFNALYNPTFNANPEARRTWLRTFKANGVNVLRVWCQWDFDPATHPFVDTAPDHTLYGEGGALVEAHLQRLIDLLLAADAQEMVIEVTLFSQEKRPNLDVEVRDRGARAVAERLKPYRNALLQVWNESSQDILRHVATIRAVDAARLVTNAPGFANDLGDPAQNRALDVLTPHTVRGKVPNFWEVAPQQIAALIASYAKPVIDDEPARTGIVQHGGIEGGTRPAWHIAQIEKVRAVGGYANYHHDMFQRPYGHPATPPNGIPDPAFSPFHRQVFEYLRAG